MPESSDFASLTSEQLFEKARRTLAGGVSHEARFASPYPTYTNRAQGSKKWDVEGREYIDYAMGSASLLLGHSHPDVTAAVTQQVAMGTRSEERRVGKGCGSTFRSRWSPYH